MPVIMARGYDNCAFYAGGHWFAARFLDGLARFIASLFGLVGNSFRDSRSVRDEITKQQELEREGRCTAGTRVVGVCGSG